MEILEKIFTRIKEVKAFKFNSSFDKDYDHAVEEFFEVIKARRAYKEIFAQLGEKQDDAAVANKLLDDFKEAKAHLREEIVDVAICCVAMFISLAGEPNEYVELIWQKLQKWSDGV